jgi:hypothetical protein
MIMARPNPLVAKQAQAGTHLTVNHQIHSKANSQLSKTSLRTSCEKRSLGKGSELWPPSFLNPAAFMRINPPNFVQKVGTICHLQRSDGTFI